MCFQQHVTAMYAGLLTGGDIAAVACTVGCRQILYYREDVVIVVLQGSNSTD